MPKRMTIKQKRNKINAIQQKALDLFTQGLFNVKDYQAVERMCDRARNRLK